MMVEVAIHEEDALRRHQVWEREESVARVTAFPTCNVLEIVRKNSHGFITLRGRHVWDVNMCLKDWAVVSGKVMSVFGKIQRRFHRFLAMNFPMDVKCFCLLLHNV